MKKIRCFKLKLRPREVVRTLKNTQAIAEVTPQIEAAVSREIERLSPLCEPAAVYETVRRDAVTIDFGLDIPKECVAVSMYAVTIGAGVEEEVRTAQQHNEALIEHLVHAVALEALEQSAQFVFRLIREEAREDECELSARQRIQPPAIVAAILSAVAADKIAITMAPDAPAPTPRYSSCGVILWLPVKKAASRR